MSATRGTVLFCLIILLLIKASTSSPVDVSQGVIKVGDPGAASLASTTITQNTTLAPGTATLSPDSFLPPETSGAPAASDPVTRIARQINVTPFSTNGTGNFSEIKLTLKVRVEDNKTDIKVEAINALTNNPNGTKGQNSSSVNVTANLDGITLQRNKQDISGKNVTTATSTTSSVLSAQYGPISTKGQSVGGITTTTTSTVISSTTSSSLIQNWTSSGTFGFGGTYGSSTGSSSQNSTLNRQPTGEYSGNSSATGTVTGPNNGKFSQSNAMFGKEDDWKDQLVNNLDESINTSQLSPTQPGGPSTSTDVWQPLSDQDVLGFASQNNSFGKYPQVGNNSFQDGYQNMFNGTNGWSNVSMPASQFGFGTWNSNATDNSTTLPDSLWNPIIIGDLADHPTSDNVASSLTDTVSVGSRLQYNRTGINVSQDVSDEGSGDDMDSGSGSEEDSGRATTYPNTAIPSLFDEDDGDSAAEDGNDGGQPGKIPLVGAGRGHLSYDETDPAAFGQDDTQQQRQYGRIIGLGKNLNGHLKDVRNGDEIITIWINLRTAQIVGSTLKSLDRAEQALSPIMGKKQVKYLANRYKKKINSKKRVEG